LVGTKIDSLDASKKAPTILLEKLKRKQDK
jgi:hypothetical protein